MRIAVKSSLIDSAIFYQNPASPSFFVIVLVVSDATPMKGETVGHADIHSKPVMTTLNRKSLKNDYFMLLKYICPS